MSVDRVDQIAKAIFEAVWHTRNALAAAPGARNPPRPLIVLVGFDLWQDLIKRVELDDQVDPWSYRDLVLRVLDAEVHVAEPPLVADAESWHLVQDLGITGGPT